MYSEIWKNGVIRKPPPLLGAKFFKGGAFLTGIPLIPRLLGWDSWTDDLSDELSKKKSKTLERSFSELSEYF